MALNTAGERTSQRRQMHSEEGGAVLALSLSQAPEEVVFQAERLDRGYCRAHPEEVREAVREFLREAGARLGDPEGLLGGL